MRSLFKVLLIAVGALFTLALVAVLLVALLFDPNDYKDYLAERFEEGTQRTVAIEGDLGLRLFPWLRITSGPVVVGNAPGFGDEPFARIQGLSASLRIWPLLRREVEIGNIRLDGLELNLAVDEEGNGNWEDLLTADEAASSPASVPHADGAFNLGDLRVAGVQIRSASVRYHDAASDQRYALEDFNFTLDALTLGEPVQASFDFDLVQQNPPLRAEVDGQATMRVDSQFERLSLSDLQVNLHVDGEADAFPERLDAQLELASAGLALNADDEIHRANGLSLTGHVFGASLPAGGVDLQLQIGSLLADMAAGTVDVPSIQAQSAGAVLLAALQIAGLNQDAPVLTGSFELPEFAPRSVLEALEIDYQPRDSAVLARASASGELRVEGQDIRISALNVLLDDTSVSGIFSRVNERLEFSFDLGEIDLDRYLPPDDEEDTGAAEDAPALNEIEIPVETLRALDAQGELRIAGLTFMDLDFRDLVVGLNAAAGELRLYPLNAALFGGSYAGDIRLDASSAGPPQLTLDQQMENVQLTALSQALFDRERVSGLLVGDIQLAGTGYTVGELRESLDGAVALALLEGIWEGVDIRYELQRAQALFRQQPAPAREGEPRTPFNDVRFSGTIADGVIGSDNLTADLRYMRVAGAGGVSLVDGTLDYRLNANILDHPDLAEDSLLENLRGVNLPLRIDGTLTSPRVAPDFGALVQEQVIDRVLEEALRFLSPDEEEDGDAQDEEEDPSAPGLQDLLRNLFGN